MPGTANSQPRHSSAAFASSDVFLDALRGALSIAALAPSSHNSQPWSLAYLATRSAREAIRDVLAEEPPYLLAIACDGERIIQALPDHAVEMLASCGMFLELLARALFQRGFDLEIIWCCEGELHVPGLPSAWRPLALLAATPRRCSEPMRDEDVEELAAARVTNRGPYAGEAVGDEARHRFETARPLVRVPDVSPMRVSVVHESAAIERMGAFVSRHAAADFAHRQAWAETYRYIRFTPEASAEAEDGFSIEQLFGPLSSATKAVLRAALSPEAMRVLALTPVPRLLAKGLGDLIKKHTPAMGVFSIITREPSPRDFLAGGVQVMASWLEATRDKLALHPVSVILQHPDLRALFSTEHGLSGRVFFLTRIGRATTTFSRTPRRNLWRQAFVEV